MTAPANRKYTITWTRADYNCEQYISLLRFRKQQFVDRLKWDVPVKGQLEVDQFDGPQTIYSILYCREIIVGCFRAIRADRSYLAETIFSNLAVDRAYPKSPDCWEISRFVVAPGPKAFRYARLNYAAMFAFARSQKARSLVAITDVAHEKYLAVNGIPTRRFGPPVNQKTNNGQPVRQLVSGEILMADQDKSTLSKFERLISGVKINDQTNVWRYQSISA